MNRNLYRVAALMCLCMTVYADRPPIPAGTADHAAAYMEWVLEARFSPDQRQRYERVLGDMWSKGSQGSRDTISGMARIHEMLPQLDDAKRQELRAASQKEFVRLLQTATDDDSRWLLGIYRAAHTDAAPAPQSGALLGRWTDGYISSIQYKNAYTGVPAPTNGRQFAYEFNPDGTFSHTGLVQSVMYNCTTSIFSNETGTYTISGDTVSLHSEKNPYKMTNNCAPNSNRESAGKTIDRTYRFRVYTEAGHRYVELRGADNAVQTFKADR